MRKRDDGFDCGKCQNELWVCECHETHDCHRPLAARMPCPECNEDIARGWPGYDRIDAVASDTPIAVEALKKTH